MNFVKRLSDTRWSTHADATQALLCGYEYIQETLETITTDMKENADTRAMAKGLSNDFFKLEIANMTEVWDCILNRFNATCKSLQFTVSVSSITTRPL